MLLYINSYFLSSRPCEFFTKRKAHHKPGEPKGRSIVELYFVFNCPVPNSILWEKFGFSSAQSPDNSPLSLFMRMVDIFQQCRWKVPHVRKRTRVNFCQIRNNRINPTNFFYLLSGRKFPVNRLYPLMFLLKELLLHWRYPVLIVSHTENPFLKTKSFHYYYNIILNYILLFLIKKLFISISITATHWFVRLLSITAYYRRYYYLFQCTLLTSFVVILTACNCAIYFLIFFHNKIASFTFYNI